MSGAIAVPDALHLFLPKTLNLPDGTAVSVPWFLQRELPQDEDAPEGQPLPDVHGVFSIISNAPRGKNRHAQTIINNNNVEILGETFNFADGTLVYNLEEEDVQQVTQVSGFVGAIPTVFVEDTDYEVGVEGLTFLTSGSLPDDASVVTVDYRHRLYEQNFEFSTTLTARVILRCRKTDLGGRQWPKSVLCDALGEDLEQKLRVAEGQGLRAPDGVTGAALPRQLQVGAVVAAGPIHIDRSQSLASYFIDFRIKRHHIISGIEYRRVLDYTPDPLV